MEYSIGWIIGSFTCLIIIGLIVVAPGFIFGFAISKKKNEELKKERKDREEYQKSIRENGGILAPAILVAAKVVKSWGGGKNRSNVSFIMDYQAEIKPEGGMPFRTSFTDELYSNGHTIVGGEMVSEHGRKIWVIYDLKDKTRAYLDHYDEKHEEGLLNTRRTAFNKLTEINEDLKKNGEQAEAVITRVDDLDLPYPSKKSRAMHLCFDVTPKTGSLFQAEGDFLMEMWRLRNILSGKGSTSALTRVSRKEQCWIQKKIKRFHSFLLGILVKLYSSLHLEK